MANSVAYDDQIGEIGHTVCVVIGDKIIHITHAGVAGMPDDYLEQRANARLIAAAPELLASLESTICYACDVPIGEDAPKDMNPCHVCAGARAAVAKARGEAL